MKKYFILPIALCMLSACSGEETQEYTQDSWKTMIPDTCLSFTDGCNTCSRSEGSDVAACTKMFCQQYSKPECLDSEAAE